MPFQIGKYIPLGSGVVSPKIWGGAKMFDFRRITLFCVEKRLSKQKMTVFSKNLAGARLLWPPPGYAHYSDSGVGRFQHIDFDPFPTPPSVSGLSNVFELYQIIKHEKIQVVFPIFSKNWGGHGPFPP